MKRLFLIFMSVLLFLCGCDGNEASVSVAGNNVVLPKSDDYYCSLDNKRCGWGFRRTENGPEFTDGQISQMEEYGCIYKENTKEKNLYLTFDEGYENGYTSVILDVLREKGVKAAFFVTAPYVKNEPELISRMAKEGHIIGNHTVNHPSMPSLNDPDKIINELTELDRLIYNICGQNCKYFRPPMGEYSTRTLAVTKDCGYTNVFWSFAYVDWKNDVTADFAEKSVLNGLHNGAVILLHAVSKGNADALGNIIDKARKEGYTFKSLDEYNFEYLHR